MKLSELLSCYQELSGKASDVSRQLAFAGVAVIWVFNGGAEQGWKVPTGLLWPLGLFCAALLLDLLQYFVAATIFSRLHYRIEKSLENPNDDPEVDIPEEKNWPAIGCYYFKVGFVLWGYALILEFIARQWSSVAPGAAT